MESRSASSAAALLLSIMASGAACGDEPPSWEPFRVCSDNSRYCASVRANGDTDRRAEERDYILTVAGDGEVLWSAPYVYDGYPGGLLTDDGKTFVYVSTWYRPDSPVVRVYREGRRFDLRGERFEVGDEALVPTVSHFLWLDRRRGSYELLDEERLRIATLDGEEHVVRLDTGALVD